jgi:hypothetical protein
MINDEDTKWLEKMYQQHIADQEKVAEKLAEVTKMYFDAKFEGLKVQIEGVKESVEGVEVTLAADVEDIVCDLKDLEKSTNKKILAGGAGAIIITLTLWTIFGTDALAVILRLISGIG